MIPIINCSYIVIITIKQTYFLITFLYLFFFKKKKAAGVSPHLKMWWKKPHTEVFLKGGILEKKTTFFIFTMFFTMTAYYFLGLNVYVVLIYVYIYVLKWF